jgi:acetylornithine deacetylase/succinyl-diaminopimelate desuccinylase-like protein
MESIQEYIILKRESILEELTEFLRIPSVSSDPSKREAMNQAAVYLCSRLAEAGAAKAVPLKTQGFPVVYAERIIHPDLPTMLVYGHYDVMPADPLDLWHSDPFQPVIRDNRIFARGADDNKGQLYIHLKAFEYLNRINFSACNIKFMIEGEEEIGSPSLPGFLREHKDLLKSDIILVSDTKMAGPGMPAVTIGLRGICYVEVEVTGPDRDLHSGHYGGVVANPAHELSAIIASLFDSGGRIALPGFYDRVAPLTAAERAELGRRIIQPEDFQVSAGAKELIGEPGYTIPEQIGARPSLDVNSLVSGHTGEGSKTIIPSKACAKITIRLVPDQEPDEILRMLKKHIDGLHLKGVTVELKNFHGSRGYASPVTSGAYHAAMKALKKAFRAEPAPVRSGGSIPIIADFEEILGTKTLLVGFGLDSDRIHGPDENFSLDNLFRGIESIVYFYEEYCGKGRY